MHQARVASRRLREAVPVLAEDVKTSKAGKAQRKIRRLTRALGAVRELDVTLTVLDELARSGHAAAGGARGSAGPRDRRARAPARDDAEAARKVKVEKLDRRLASVGGGAAGGRPSAGARRSARACQTRARRSARHRRSRADVQPGEPAPGADRDQEAALRAGDRRRSGTGGGAARPAAEEGAGHARAACTTCRCSKRTSRRSRRRRRPASCPKAASRRWRARSKTSAATCTAATSRCRPRCARRLPTAPARCVAQLVRPGARRRSLKMALASKPQARRNRAAAAAELNAAGRGRGRALTRMATFELYLIRHGVAAERGEEYPDDSKRPLTAQGSARLRKEARALDALGVGFDQIVTSPLVRTRQTADVFAETLKSKPSVVDLRRAGARGHAGGGDAGARQAHAKKGSVALVGHEPNLGELAGTPDRRAPRRWPFKKGGDLPHRLRDVPAQGHRPAALVRHAADAAQAGLRRFASCSPLTSSTALHLPARCSAPRAVSNGGIGRRRVPIRS